jgi:hypothetical protein
MKNSHYEIQEETPSRVCEPTVTYGRINESIVLPLDISTENAPDFYEDSLMDFDEWKEEYHARRANRNYSEEEEDEVDGRWNPNAPFQATQEEWYERVAKIEEGEFVTWEEAEKDFEEWKSAYLTSRL